VRRWDGVGCGAVVEGNFDDVDVVVHGWRYFGGNWDWKSGDYVGKVI
jgi:hypothetical protein